MTFRPNYKGVGDMLKSKHMAARMLKRAEKVKARAETTAPRSGDTRDTPYADRFEASTRMRADRVVGVVSNDHPAALHIELGTRDTPKHRTLGKALSAAKE